MEETPLFWIGSALRDLRKFPREIRREMKFALYRAQVGRKHAHTKPLRGFGGAGVLEVVENFLGDTYRAVYTVKFADVVYAIHAFQKKASQGRKTSKRDVALIRERLRAAQEHYDSWHERG